MKKLISKNQRGARLRHIDQSGTTWGNRGQGNELQSALENGLSWVGDKVVNGFDYLDQGLSYLVGLIPGGMTAEEAMQDTKNKQLAMNSGKSGYVNHYGKYEAFPITGIAPSPAILGGKVKKWGDLYKGVSDKTKITTGSPEKIYKFRKATDTYDRFAAGQDLELVLENSNMFKGYWGHGITKWHDEDALAHVRTILRYGTDPERKFHTAAMYGNTRGIPNGTSSGKAYTDGPFILVGNGKNTTDPKSFTHVLINPGLTDESLELANKYKAILQKEFPNVKILLYNEVK